MVRAGDDAGSTRGADQEALKRGAFCTVRFWRNDAALDTLNAAVRPASSHSTYGNHDDVGPQYQE
jgi:hypothetical protein